MNNYPDDYNAHWQRCICGARYHAADGYCQACEEYEVLCAECMKAPVPEEGMACPKCTKDIMAEIRWEIGRDDEV